MNLDDAERLIAGIGKSGIAKSKRGGDGNTDGRVLLQGPQAGCGNSLLAGNLQGIFRKTGPLSQRRQAKTAMLQSLMRTIPWSGNREFPQPMQGIFSCLQGMAAAHAGNHPDVLPRRNRRARDDRGKKAEGLPRHDFQIATPQCATLKARLSRRDSQDMRLKAWAPGRISRAFPKVPMEGSCARAAGDFSRHPTPANIGRRHDGSRAGTRRHGQRIRDSKDGSALRVSIASERLPLGDRRSTIARGLTP